MNVVDAAGLSRRILELLRLGPEGVVELSLLKSGAVLVSKSQEDG
jgi:hypothetical protein